MPFGVPTFWVSSLLVVQLLPIRSKCTAQYIVWGWGLRTWKSVTSLQWQSGLFPGKERKRIPDSSSCVSYHFTRKFEDSERQYTWDNWIRLVYYLQICAALSEWTFTLENGTPWWLASWRPSGISVAETSRPWLLQDWEKIKTTLVSFPWDWRHLREASGGS